MKLPVWVVGLLTVIANTIGGLSTMHFVAEKSSAGIALSVLGLVVGNVLAVFAPALAGKPAVVLTAVPKDE